MSELEKQGPRSGRSAPEKPAHPERICWGCERFCPADALACGMDTVRAPHPHELFGDDWRTWVATTGRQDPEETA
ncbi:DUF3079 domain-containing protein [bacterium CPR1]|nr:DUF3079 domain-containing protein [bacterium CPR1]